MHLRDGRRGGDAGPPWGEEGAREKKGGQRGWEGVEPLGVWENYGGCEASGVDPDPHEVEWDEGGLEASGVEE